MNTANYIKSFSALLNAVERAALTLNGRKAINFILGDHYYTPGSTYVLNTADLSTLSNEQLDKYTERIAAIKLSQTLSLDQVADLINDMRDWICEELFERYDDYEVEAMTDEELIRTINESYDGGYDQFVENNLRK